PAAREPQRRVARERPDLEDPLGPLHPGQQLEQATLERRDVGGRQAGLPRRLEDRLEIRLRREKPAGEELVDSGRIRPGAAHSSASLARRTASRRPRATSTASVCSGCSPPWSAAAAAETTGSRCSWSLSSRVATASLARQPSSSANAASIA